MERYHAVKLMHGTAFQYSNISYVFEPESLSVDLSTRQETMCEHAFEVGKRCQMVNELLLSMPRHGSHVQVSGLDCQNAMRRADFTKCQVAKLGAR